MELKPVHRKSRSRIALITACGAKKRTNPMEAFQLYRSSRIKAVYNRRGICDMFILSSEYGLIGAHQIIAPYGRIMDKERAIELIPSVAKKLQSYDNVIYFKGGARKAYLYCVEEACRRAGKMLVTLGYANMGGINDLPNIISLVVRGNLEKIQDIEHAKVYFF